MKRVNTVRKICCTDKHGTSSRQCLHSSLSLLKPVTFSLHGKVWEQNYYLHWSSLHLLLTTRVKLPWKYDACDVSWKSVFPGTTPCVWNTNAVCCLLDVKTAKPLTRTFLVNVSVVGTDEMIPLLSVLVYPDNPVPSTLVYPDNIPSISFSIPGQYPFQQFKYTQKFPSHQF